MRSATTAGAIGGLAAGLLLSGVTQFGRDAGLLERTMGENMKVWLNRTFNTRGRVGDNGTAVIEQAIHLNTSVAFGSMYGRLRTLLKGVPPVVLGTLYGTGLYAVAIATVAPRIGLARDPEETPVRISVQRLGLHILFGIATALATDALLDRPRIAD